jgi:CubicO group peptidase (beta-lactamase class C family)
MRLVERGLIDLDRPLTAVLPDLVLADDLARRATVRHLLNHSSGLDGDVITDTGRGDDCLRAYVESLAGAGINHPLGATWSYCNAGYVILGRIIEQLTGRTWDAALRWELAEPLGLERVYTLPEECMLDRFAVGHVAEPGEQPHVAPAWGLPRSLGPAGLITCGVEEVLAFAGLHLRDGRTASGARVLSSELTQAMQAHEVDLPDRYSFGDSWGLGLIRFEWDGRRVVGHDGATIGQEAYLRMVPELGLAVAVLTNGGNSGDLFQAAITELLASLGGIAVPGRPEPVPGARVIDAERYVGRYRRASRDTDVYLDGDRLMLRATVTGELAEFYENPVSEHELRPLAGAGEFAYRDEGQRHWSPVVFYELADGSPYVHYSVRANPRSAS